MATSARRKPSAINDATINNSIDGNNDDGNKNKTSATTKHTLYSKVSEVIEVTGLIARVSGWDGTDAKKRCNVDCTGVGHLWVLSQTVY